MTPTSDLLAEYLSDAQALALNRRYADDDVTTPEAILTLAAVMVDIHDALQDIRHFLDPDREA